MHAHPNAQERDELGRFAGLDVCPNGHPRTPDNIYIKPSSGARECRACRREQSRRQPHSLERRTWKAMKERCTNPNHVAWKRYGGRGIRVCDRWLSSFAAFVEDMGQRPAGRTLDRVDPNGDYTPENCRWATAAEQARNKTRCVSHKEATS